MQAGGLPRRALEYLFNAATAKGGAKRVAQGVQGTAMLIKDFVDAGWIELGTEINIRTKSGLEGRIDAVLIYKADGQVVYVVGEAKNGPFADLNANQRLYLREISAGEFEFTGPKGHALNFELMKLNATQVGAVVRSFGGSPAENRPVGKAVNDAFRDAASRGGIRGGWLGSGD